MTPGIGNPGAYEKLMGRLPHGHFDVIIPVELPEGRRDPETVKACRNAIHLTAKAFRPELRYALTHDQQKHEGAFIVRAIGPQSYIAALRARLGSLDI